MPNDTIPLVIPDDAWRDTKGDGTRLITTVALLGELHHLEALEVAARVDGEEQHGINAENDAILLGWWSGIPGDGPWRTVTITGRQYVLLMTPFTE